MRFDVVLEREKSMGECQSVVVPLNYDQNQSQVKFIVASVVNSDQKLCLI